MLMKDLRSVIYFAPKNACDPLEKGPIRIDDFKVSISASL